MSILVTVIAEAALLSILRYLVKKTDNKKNLQIIALSILLMYFVCLFMITLGNRTSDSAGETNLILFSTFRRMFAPTLHRLQEWGFPRGLQELKWIGYPSWESIVLNLLLLVPLGYLAPMSIRIINTWWKALLTGFVISLLIETAQLVFHRGWFDVDDIFLKTLGTVGGWCLYKRIIEPITVREQKPEENTV